MLIPDEEPGKRRYGQCGACPEGVAEDPSRCVAKVADGYRDRQCSRLRGYGPDGQLCKQHAAKYEKIYRRHEVSLWT